MVFEPTIFGRYVLLKRIAIGGMAEVFRAVAHGAEGFEKLVAIKRILPHLSSDPQFVDMFINEAKLAANLNHANIIHIFDFGVIEESLFLSMEFIRGKNTAELIETLKSRGLTVPVELACFVIVQVLNGLDHAHRLVDRYGNPANLIHRDISPPNIIVSYDGEVKIGDFGIAKAKETKIKTSSGVLKGKYAYMSPEQAHGGKLDPRTDIFSLGICFYELLTLTELFSADSDLAVLRAVRAAKVDPPSKHNPAVPEALDKLVLKALAKDPSDRFSSAAEFRLALERFMIETKLRFSTAWLSIFMQDIFRAEMADELDKQRLEALRAEQLRPEAASLARMEAASEGAVDTMVYPNPVGTLPGPGAADAVEEDEDEEEDTTMRVDVSGAVSELLSGKQPVVVTDDDEETLEVEDYNRKFSYPSDRERRARLESDRFPRPPIDMRDESNPLDAGDFQRTDRDGRPAVRPEFRPVPPVEDQPTEAEDYIETDNILLQAGQGGDFEGPAALPTAFDGDGGGDHPRRRFPYLLLAGLILVAAISVGIVLAVSDGGSTAGKNDTTTGDSGGELAGQDAGSVVMDAGVTAGADPGDLEDGGLSGEGAGAAKGDSTDADAADADASDAGMLADGGDGPDGADAVDGADSQRVVKPRKRKKRRRRKRVKRRRVKRRKRHRRLRRKKRRRRRR